MISVGSSGESRMLPVTLMKIRLRSRVSGGTDWNFSRTHVTDCIRLSAAWPPDHSGLCCVLCSLSAHVLCLNALSVRLVSVILSFAFVVFFTVSLLSCVVSKKCIPLHHLQQITC